MLFLKHSHLAASGYFPSKPPSSVFSVRKMKIAKEDVAEGSGFGKSVSRRENLASPADQMCMF